MSITNSTISGNSATISGGGIKNDPGGILLVSNSTVSANSAVTGGGISVFNPFQGNADLVNTIVASQTSGGDCAGIDFTSLGHNLDSDDTCLLTDPDDLPGAVPLLGPLQDNGGPTLTHALLPGSPAIDAGGLLALVRDQRGVTRSLGAGSDIRRL